MCALGVILPSAWAGIESLVGSEPRKWEGNTCNFKSGAKIGDGGADDMCSSMTLH